MIKINNQEEMASFMKSLVDNDISVTSCELSYDAISFAPVCLIKTSDDKVYSINLEVTEEINKNQPLKKLMQITLGNVNDTNN